MVKTENPRAGEFIVSEANGKLSRETIQIAAGAGALMAGAVLGEVTASPGVYAPFDAGASDGTEVAAAILYAGVPASDDVQAGVGFVRLGEVAAESLVFAEGQTAAGQSAALDDLAGAFVLAR